VTWKGFTPSWVQYDDGPFQRFYLGSEGDTAPPRYVEPGLANVYRCTCCCSEVTHQLPGGHCLMPSCKDEPCTVKTPDPWLEQVADITGLRDPNTWT
jgi:hypothetical protein